MYLRYKTQSNCFFDLKLLKGIQSIMDSIVVGVDRLDKE